VDLTVNVQVRLVLSQPKAPLLTAIPGAGGLGDRGAWRAYCLSVSSVM
jgi:hypothetical protein